MNLAPFQDLTFEDSESFDDFRLSLQLNHDKIASIMFAAGNVYRTYPLIDNVEHTRDWQQNLQQELASIFRLNGLTGLPDLSGADLGREQDFADFMEQLIFVERRVNAFLGIH